jgi:hypothetical protein
MIATAWVLLAGDVDVAAVVQSPPTLCPSTLCPSTLQALREKAGLSHEQAAEAIFSSPWTIRRMEKTEGGLNRNKVKGLLIAYGVTDAREIGAFQALAREASTPGWWHNYGDVLPAWFRVVPGLEEAADLIRGYEPQFIPGLLQTEDYARALTAIGFPDAPAEENERRLALRMGRQRLLTRPSPACGETVRFSTVRRGVVSVAAGEKDFPAAADGSSTIRWTLSLRAEIARRMGQREVTAGREGFAECRDDPAWAFLIGMK